MQKKHIMIFFLGFLLILSTCSDHSPARGDRIARLHDEALVWVCHNDLVLRALYENLDIGRRLPYGHVDIPRLREGRVDVQTVALYVHNFLCCCSVYGVSVTGSIGTEYLSKFDGDDDPAASLISIAVFYCLTRKI